VADVFCLLSATRQRARRVAGARRPCLRLPLLRCLVAHSARHRPCGTKQRSPATRHRPPQCATGRSSTRVLLLEANAEMAAKYRAATACFSCSPCHSHSPASHPPPPNCISALSSQSIRSAEFRAPFPQNLPSTIRRRTPRLTSIAHHPRTDVPPPGRLHRPTSQASHIPPLSEVLGSLPSAGTCHPKEGFRNIPQSLLCYATTACLQARDARQPSSGAPEERAHWKALDTPSPGWASGALCCRHGIFLIPFAFAICFKCSLGMRKGRRK
jgi:hypothetical protein